MAADKAPRRCPVDGRKLWPVPRVRQIRWHDLRHTTASLLLQAGASLAAVQRIMRHADPRITTEIYGHLEQGHLRAEVNRLRFGLPTAAVAPAPRVEARAVANLPQNATVALPEPENRAGAVQRGDEKDSDFTGLNWSGRLDSNQRPLGPEPSALPG